MAKRMKQQDGSLDHAVRTISCSRDWADFEAALRRGYVPTLRTDVNVCPSVELRDMAQRVIDACRAARLRIYAPGVDEVFPMVSGPVRRDVDAAQSEAAA